MTDTSPTPLDRGTLVKLTRDVPADFSGDRVYTKGQTFTIEDYVSVEESEDGIPFYWGNTRADNINDICAPADAVELVKSKAQMDARIIPTRAQMMDMLGSAVMSDGNGFTVNESYKDSSSGVIECAGETDDGLTFAFNITVTTPHETDF